MSDRAFPPYKENHVGIHYTPKIQHSPARDYQEGEYLDQCRGIKLENRNHPEAEGNVQFRNSKYW
jgi:hypothetical protein